MAEQGPSLIRRWYVLIVVGVAAAFSLGVALSQRVADQATPSMQRAAEIADPKDRVAAETGLLQYQTANQAQIWTGIVQALGASVLAIGGYVGWKNFKITELKIEADRRASEASLALAKEDLEETKRKIEADQRSAEKNFELAREQQITNRLMQAFGQLGAELHDGSPNLEVRLGGIYALERIARDSPRNHWTIMEVLTAYVRRNASWSPSLSSELRIDVQTILVVLARRIPPSGYDWLQPGAYFYWSEPTGLDLHGTDLRGVELTGQRLGTHLEEGAPISFIGAQLQMANFAGAHLENAQLAGAMLTGANLTHAHFKSANLRGADLTNAILKGADLSKAVGLTAIQIQSSYERGSGARLPWASTDDSAALNWPGT
jgi:hypothetical protein